MVHQELGMYKKISDYGIIGNSQTAALVGNDGSIDWLCLPSFDSPSVFGALLDKSKGGRFMVSPRENWDSTAAYLPGTNILTTIFRTPKGRVRLTDYMPVALEGCPEKELPHQKLIRRVEALEGKPGISLHLDPRFDYGRATAIVKTEGLKAVARSSDQVLTLQATKPGLKVEDERVVADWDLESGDEIWLCLDFGMENPEEVMPQKALESLEETRSFWHDWLARSETRQDFDFGPFRDMVERSSLVLKLLDFAPTGAILAAPTTSLPEEIGGGRNWDYRFSWIRDSALTVQALFNIGHLSEMERYLNWLEKFVCEGEGHLQVLYGLRGETQLIEMELPHLDGYKGSRPVRIGNEAYRQRQLDIYGEILDAALRLSNYAGKISFSMWPFLRTLCDTVVKDWQEKDAGIWEVRGGPYHFVYSKVMCWVALDRGLTIARRYGFPADLGRWDACRDEIRKEVLHKGWSERRKSFVQHYDSEELDASVLLIPFYGFLPYDDPRMVSTVAAIEKDLTRDGFVYRYLNEDGLAGDEGSFQLCSFWLVDNLIGQNRLEEAQIMLLRLEKTANNLGLFAEEYDPFWREPLGNYPQAFTHIGYINSVYALCHARRMQQHEASPKPLPDIMRQKLFIGQRFILNEGAVGKEETVTHIIGDLKHLMNLLRGNFFNTAAGRVAYEEMADSSLFRQYGECSRYLQQFDLSLLKSRKEKLAFWINLFNVLVIHGVIELGIRDSVLEVPRFFRRIGYRLGEMKFSADDIEHGILRNNHRYPHSLFHPFDKEDPRSMLAISPIDPRIHFALVCASVTCPPIEIYSPQNLDEELDISGRTFLNSGGVKIDREKMTVRLPRIFKWYGEDFGKNLKDRLHFVASYLFREEDRNFLETHADQVTVEYHLYDWRLNRV